MVYDLQKASLWKRIAAWLFDSILVMILAVGVAALLSGALGYDRHSDTVNDAYSHYEAEYDVTFDVTQEEYLSWSEAERQRYDEAYEALRSFGFQTSRQDKVFPTLEDVFKEIKGDEVFDCSQASMALSRRLKKMLARFVIGIHIFSGVKI